MSLVSPAPVPAAVANDNRVGRTFVIETGHVAAGIVVRQGKGYQFYAAHNDFHSLDGSIFATPIAAQKAVDLVHAANKIADARLRIERLTQRHREAGR